MTFNTTPPTNATKQMFLGVSGVFGILDFYLVVALVVYEVFVPRKPRSGKPLRSLCILTALSALCFEISIQSIVLFSDESETSCFYLMLVKTSMQNLMVSFAYGFIWLRQYLLYSSKTFAEIRGTKLKIVTFLVLCLLIANPGIMFGFQFKGKLYSIENGVCAVLRISFIDQIPFMFVSFSYGFIQVSKTLTISINLI